MEYRLETIEAKLLAGMRADMCLANNKTAELWRSFMPRRHEVVNIVSDDLYSVERYGLSGLSNFTSATVFEKWAAVQVSSAEDLPAGMDALQIEGGLYVVFTYRGAANNFAEAFRYIFTTWLPASSYGVDDRAHFAIMGEKYKGNDPSSEEEMWIPIKPK